MSALGRAPSARAGEGRATCRIFQIVRFIEQRHTPFAVSRLIMLSGVKVRQYFEDSVDSLPDLAKVRRAARQILSPADQAELGPALADQDP